MSRRVLFVTTEIAPLNKVGGLGDVGHGLVPALRRDGWDVRILIPGFAAVLAGCRGMRPVLELLDADWNAGRILEGRAPGVDAPLYVADFPHQFLHCPSPYGNMTEGDPDDARRFAAFCRAALALARGLVADWQPDVIHCNDWTSGLVPALLHGAAHRPATVFTVHNLAHQGLFSRHTFEALALPEALWHLEGLEFHGHCSFIKGGLAFADRINTVSPTYAREILTSAFGCGLDGLLRHRQERLSGILNGIDAGSWDPARDPHLAAAFSPAHMDGKRACKLDLQRRLELTEDPDVPVVAMVSRLTYQKGIDLVVEAWDNILKLGVQLAVLGTGDAALEAALAGEAARHPGRCAVSLAYDEPLSHRLVAGADLFLMPSRFEPCGLTQLYALRYGTVPVVARTGGLLDTVMHGDAEALAAGAATGWLLDAATPAAVVAGLRQALDCYGSDAWRRLQHAGMAEDLGWDQSARHYGALYHQALADCSAR
jgi:starch synthase